MQIVIPMSGFGERFRRAGYKVPKPLIEVEGLPMIAHVVNRFPGETDFKFICNQDHLDEDDFAMRDAILTHCPSAKIFGIPPHKLGPVHAVTAIRDELDLEAPTVVNYCDFSWVWDYGDFKSFVETTGCAGAIPVYRGFHPHSLRSAYYAYLKHTDGWADDIQEKTPFTDTPMNEFASSGTYYFSSARLMLEAMDSIVDLGLKVNDEYYVSIVYKALFEQNLPVALYELQHFLQWGTPDDLAEYTYYSDLFQGMAQAAPEASGLENDLIVPMAGEGKRFSDQGYTEPKPLIRVSGVPMALQVANDFQEFTPKSFIVRSDLPQLDKIKKEISKAAEDAKFVELERLTEGQAETVYLATEESKAERSLTIVACDAGQLFDGRELKRFRDQGEFDVLVFGARAHPAARLSPNMFSWVDFAAEGSVKAVSLKTQVQGSGDQIIVTGSFWFKRSSDYRRCFETLASRDERVNGEFYIDACINVAIELGLRVGCFEVDHYVGWGTPDELRTFAYWQSCFDQLQHHPYSLEADSRVPRSCIQEMRSGFNDFSPRVAKGLGQQLQSTAAKPR